jgi:hypothetical protein
MRILFFTIDLNGDFRTGDGAQSAAGAAFVFVERNGAVPHGVVFRGGNDATLLAGGNAEVAFLAAFPVDFDAAFHSDSFVSTTTDAKFLAQFTAKVKR